VLDPYAVKDRQWRAADYPDNALAMYKAGGKQYALPLLWSPIILYYNQSMFERAGRKVPDDTWTWETLLDAARALTKPSNDPNVMGEYGFGVRDFINWYLPWVVSNGGEVWNADGTKCTLATPEATEGLQFAADLIHRWKVSYTMQERDARGLGSYPFQRGNLAVVFDGSPALPTYRLGAQVWEFDVAPLPKGKKGRKTAALTASLAMWSGSRAPEAAWAYMRHLVGEEASRQYAAFVGKPTIAGGGMGGLPVHKAAARLILQDSELPKGRQAFVDALGYAQPPVPSGYAWAAVGALGQAMKPMWYEGQPAAVVMPEVVRVVNAKMDEEISASVTR
jgi:multiple sugar transport system substrate-binding protein